MSDCLVVLLRPYQLVFCFSDKINDSYIETDPGGRHENKIFVSAINLKTLIHNYYEGLAPGQ